MGDVIIVTIFILAGYYFTYNAFEECFSDDHEFIYGRSSLKNRRKKTKEFWKRFFFLDIREKVAKWHYCLFWINLIAFIPMYIAIIAYVLSNIKEAKLAFLICGGIYFLSSMPIVFARWDLYRGNVIRNRKEYRKGYHRKRKQ